MRWTGGDAERPQATRNEISSPDRMMLHLAEKHRIQITLEDFETLRAFIVMYIGRYFATNM